MNINVSRRQTIGGLAVAALLAGLVAVGLSNRFPADDPPAPKADDFSPYVTKDRGISLPLDYREKFLHLGSWAVATKPDKPVDELHGVYARPEDVQAYRRDGKSPTARCWSRTSPVSARRSSRPDRPAGTRGSRSGS